MGAADPRNRLTGTPAPARAGRDPAFDGLRVIALLAGVLFHATLSYADVPLAVTPWPRLDADPSRLASVLLWWTRTFHLPLFFFLAGFAAAHSLRRRGRKAFLVERVRPIVSDERIGHRNDLTAIGGVRENLLVSGHGSVETNLADLGSFGTKGFAFENTTIL